MVTTGLRKFNEKTISAVNEALIKDKNTIEQYLITFLLGSKLVDTEEQARLEMQYDFNQEGKMKEIDSYFTEN